MFAFKKLVPTVHLINKDTFIVSDIKADQPFPILDQQ